MAERRMFAKSVVQSGRFIQLPGKTQALYFQLGMFADDDGFVTAPEFAMQATGTTRRDISRLLEEGLLYRFEGNVLLIRHWLTHNTIQRDRFRPTIYQKELAMVTVRNRVYEMETDCIQNGNNLDPQIKLNKNKQNKTNIGQTNAEQVRPVFPAGEARAAKPDFLAVASEIALNGYVVSASDFYHYYEGNGWMEEGQPVQDWKALLAGWERRARYVGTP